eukprot:Clim_evm59s156 gene=Clim_evmTU59s156
MFGKDWVAPGTSPSAIAIFMGPIPRYFRTLMMMTLLLNYTASFGVSSTDRNVRKWVTKIRMSTQAVLPFACTGIMWMLLTYLMPISYLQRLSSFRSCFRITSLDADYGGANPSNMIFGYVDINIVLLSVSTLWGLKQGHDVYQGLWLSTGSTVFLYFYRSLFLYHTLISATVFNAIEWSAFRQQFLIRDVYDLVTVLSAMFWDWRMVYSLGLYVFLPLLWIRLANVPLTAYQDFPETIDRHHIWVGNVDLLQLVRVLLVTISFSAVMTEMCGNIFPFEHYTTWGFELFFVVSWLTFSFLGYLVGILTKLIPMHVSLVLSSFAGYTLSQILQTPWPITIATVVACVMGLTLPWVMKDPGWTKEKAALFLVCVCTCGGWDMVLLVYDLRYTFRTGLSLQAVAVMLVVTAALQIVCFSSVAIHRVSRNETRKRIEKILGICVATEVSLSFFLECTLAADRAEIYTQTPSSHESFLQTPMYPVWFLISTAIINAALCVYLLYTKMINKTVGRIVLALGGGKLILVSGMNDPTTVYTFTAVLLVVVHTLPIIGIGSLSASAIQKNNGIIADKDTVRKLRWMEAGIAVLLLAFWVQVFNENDFYGAVPQQTRLMLLIGYFKLSLSVVCVGVSIVDLHMRRINFIALVVGICCIGFRPSIPLVRLRKDFLGLILNPLGLPTHEVIYAMGKVRQDHGGVVGSYADFAAPAFASVTTASLFLLRTYSGFSLSVRRFLRMAYVGQLSMSLNCLAALYGLPYAHTPLCLFACGVAGSANVAWLYGALSGNIWKRQELYFFHSLGTIILIGTVLTEIYTVVAAIKDPWIVNDLLTDTTIFMIAFHSAYHLILCAVIKFVLSSSQAMLRNRRVQAIRPDLAICGNISVVKSMLGMTLVTWQYLDAPGWLVLAFTPVVLFVNWESGEKKTRARYYPLVFTINFVALMFFTVDLCIFLATDPSGVVANDGRFIDLLIDLAALILALPAHVFFARFIRLGSLCREDILWPLLPFNAFAATIAQSEFLWPFGIVGCVYIIMQIYLQRSDARGRTITKAL